MMVPVSRLAIGMKHAVLQRLFVTIIAQCFLQCSCHSQEKDNQVFITNLLVRQYESVIFAKGAILYSPSTFPKLPKEIFSKLQIPFADLLGAMGQDDVVSKSLLSERNIEFVVVGAGNFHPPKGLGSVLADTCYVIKLSRAHSVDIQRHPPGVPVTGENGSSVWRLARPTQSVAPQFYISQPSAKYIVVANDLVQLRIVNDRITSSLLLGRQEERDLLESIPNKEEMRQSPLWGYRSYHHTSSAASKQASGALDVDPSGVALVFFMNPQANSASIEYISLNDSDDTVSKFHASGTLPEFKHLRKGLWVTEVSLVSGRNIDEQMFTIISMFGFGIYL